MCVRTQTLDAHKRMILVGALAGAGGEVAEMRSINVGEVRRVGSRVRQAGVVAAIGAGIMAVGPLSSATTAITNTPQRDLPGTGRR